MTYQVITIEEYIAALRLNLSSAFLFFLLFPWFIAEYTGVRPKRLLVGFSILFVFLLVANIMLPNTIQFQAIQELEHFRLPWGEILVRPVGIVGIWFGIAVSAILFSFGFAFLALILHYRRDCKRTALIMLFAMVLVIVASVVGILTRASVVEFVPLGPFGFVAMIIVMSLVLNYEARQSSAQLQAILDNIPAVVSIKDTEGRYLMINRKYEDLFHITNTTILGKTDYDLFSKHNADMQREKDQQVLSTVSSLEFEETTDNDNDQRTYLAVKFPLFNINGNPYAVCNVSTDITERRQTDEALRRSQKMEAVGQLAGGIAHDFNNRLGVITGYLNLLNEHMSGEEKTLKWVETATQAAWGCADLTKQLLVFSQQKPSEISLVELNQEVSKIDSLITHAMTPAISVQILSSKGLWPVAINPYEFQDVILNLAINARDAMPEGGKLLIETSNKVLDDQHAANNSKVTPGEYVQILVSDTGQGIDKKTMEHIFEPFFTTKPEGKGTGLGLSMVYGFTKRHSGFVKVNSELGKGTTFHLYLPRMTDPEVTALADTSNKTVLPRGNETVLIVDDEVEILNLADQYLRDLGYRTLLANNASQALDVISEHADIDLMFSDIVMPGGINGYLLAEEAVKVSPNLKVLLTSGFVNNVTPYNSQEMLTGNLLPKPYNKDDLAMQIRQVLDENLEQANNMRDYDSKEIKLAGATILVIDDESDMRKLFDLNLKKLGCKTILACNGNEAVSLYQQSLEDNKPIDLVILDLSFPGDIDGKEIAHKLRLLDSQVKIIVASGHTGSPEMTHFQDYGFQGALDKYIKPNEIKKVLDHALKSS